MDYALVGAAAEWKVRIAEILYEGSVHKDVQIWKDLAEALVFKYVLMLEAGVAPDGLAGFLFDTAGKLGEGFYLVERIAS